MSDRQEDKVGIAIQRAERAMRVCKGMGYTCVLAEFNDMEALLGVAREWLAARLPSAPPTRHTYRVLEDGMQEHVRVCEGCEFDRALLREETTK